MTKGDPCSSVSFEPKVHGEGSGVELTSCGTWLGGRRDNDGSMTIFAVGLPQSVLASESKGEKGRNESRYWQACFSTSLDSLEGPEISTSVTVCGTVVDIENDRDIWVIASKEFCDFGALISNTGRLAVGFDDLVQVLGIGEYEMGPWSKLERKNVRKTLRE